MAKKYKTALENLQASKRLLRTRWTKGGLAYDEEGNDVSPRSYKAVTFCSIGAVRHIDGPGEKEALKFLRKAAKLELLNAGDDETYSGDSPIIKVNDGHGYRHVDSMFSRAIKLAKEV